MAPPLINPRIKLRHLACFLEVARLHSVVRAAEQLNMSQPAASKTIQELEATLGARLFDRSRRTLALTPAGETLQRYATVSISALKQGVDSVHARLEPHLLRVGALPTVSARILPEAVLRFTAQPVRHRIRVTTGPNEYLLAQLRSGSVDIVIGRMAEPHDISGLSFEHLYSERIVFAVRPGHPLLNKRRFDLTAIEGFQLLFPPPGSVILPNVERLLTAHNVLNPRDDVETVSNAFGHRYTRLTDAVWIISEGVVAEEVATGQLALLPVDTTETYGPVGLTMRTGETLAEGTASFVEIVRTVAAEQAPNTSNSRSRLPINTV